MSRPGSSTRPSKTISTRRLRPGSVARYDAVRMREPQSGPLRGTWATRRGTASRRRTRNVVTAQCEAPPRPRARRPRDVTRPDRSREASAPRPARRRRAPRIVREGPYRVERFPATQDRELDPVVQLPAEQLSPEKPRNAAEFGPRPGSHLAQQAVPAASPPIGRGSSARQISASRLAPTSTNSSDRHQPRPGRRQERQRPRRCHAPRQAVRGGRPTRSTPTRCPRRANETSRPATWPPARTSRRRRRSAHGYGGLLLRLLQLRRRRPLRRVHHAVRQHAAGTPGRHVPVIAVSRALQVAPHRCHPIPLRASSDDAGARVASTSMQPAAARRHRHGGVLVPDASSIALSGRPRPRRPGDRVMPAPPDGGHLA